MFSHLEKLVVVKTVLENKKSKSRYSTDYEPAVHDKGLN